MTVDPLSRHWPFFGLRLRSKPLVLRLPCDDDLAALAELAAGGVHDPDEMPFLSPWTAAAPGTLERNTLQWGWRARAELQPEHWELSFGVWRDDALVGVQSISADEFAVTRAVVTGSWLGRPHQGMGTGRLMRAVVLSLAFDGLDAVEARSGALDGNPASAAVSQALGYRHDGHEVRAVQGTRRVEQRFVMTLRDWRARPRPSVTIEGLDACLDLLGARRGG